MSKYPTTNIVYSGIEDKGGPTVTILDEKRNKWTIWKADYENKDQNSEAFGSLQSFKMGESFGIEYGEKEESFTPKDGPNAGRSIKFTRRTIYKILPLVPNPATVSSTPAKESTGGANRGQSGGSSGSKDHAFWEQQAYEKCCSLWASARLQGGSSPVEIEADIAANRYWDLFRAIKADGAKRFSPEAIRPTNLDLPTIQIDEDKEVLDAIAQDTPF